VGFLGVEFGVKVMVFVGTSSASVESKVMVASKEPLAQDLLKKISVY
jgi:hypothetical protein